MPAERFNLTWDQFEASVGNSFRDLLNDKDFTDVTLVTEDDEHIKAHKVVLSTCSPVLKNILIKNHHQHPLIYLSDIKSKAMKALVNFIYLGETEVGQDDLDLFMKAASKFKIKGLSNDMEAKTQNEELLPYYSEPQTEKKKRAGLEVGYTHRQKESFIKQEEVDANIVNSCEVSVIPRGDEVTIDEGDIFRVDNLFQGNEVRKLGSAYKCQKCDYQAIKGSHLKAHIKAKHEGIKFPCSMCEYKASFSSDLKRHQRTKHSSVQLNY
jgi:hypothetical protein